MTPSLHPNLEPIAGLVGTWRGAGEGSYPTIEDFAYTEEVTFGHVGKPFLSYVQRTRDATSGLPLHAESGYLRAGDRGELELVIAQPSGIVEVHEGELDGGTLAFRAVTVTVTASAKSVTDVLRRITIDGDALRYTLDMAAVGLPLQHHLAATLHRVTE
jgi:hypothetical protein